MYKRVSLLVSLVVAVGMLVAASTAAAQKKDKPLIQMAILLDTSNSMDGLIHQAKSQLWKVVNEFATAKRDGKRPELQVALYEYGNSNLSREEGYIRRVLALTNDLDKVSEELFALKTRGGSEYCGQVIDVAVGQLGWSKNANDLKVIFIAGNEPFTQGPVDYRKACKDAIKKGIIVNTIHCGSVQEGIRGQWKDGALLADGKYMNIDQNKAVVHIAAPQDKEIVRLGNELNKTYIGYGSARGAAAERQMVQDANAASVGKSSSVNRAVFKSTAQYRNDYWDLVDAVKNGRVKLKDLKKEVLPEAMKKMSPKERKAFIDKKLKERAELQAKIRKLNEERKKYVASKMKAMAAKGDKTLDSVMIQSIREQAVKRNYKFK